MRRSDPVHPHSLTGLGYRSGSAVDRINGLARLAGHGIAGSKIRFRHSDDILSIKSFELLRTAGHSIHCGSFHRNLFTGGFTCSRGSRSRCRLIDIQRFDRRAVGKAGKFEGTTGTGIFIALGLSRSRCRSGFCRFRSAGKSGKSLQFDRTAGQGAAIDFRRIQIDCRSALSRSISGDLAGHSGLGIISFRDVVEFCHKTVLFCHYILKY